MPDHHGSLFPFALLPAAGRSRRMGAPKLLLDLGGKTVMARVLSALAQAGVVRRVVVTHPDDIALRAEIDAHGGHALTPALAPPDMRASVVFGLRTIHSELEATGTIADPDTPWLLVPADHPVLSAETVRSLLDAASKQPGKIVVPTHHGRRGHPTVLAWKHAAEVDQIPDGQGPNAILRRHAAEVIEVTVPSDSVLLDLDTPSDYERLVAEWGS